MVQITTTESVTLDGGRRLGYADFGDPDGTPILFFHGTPGSRLSGLLPGVVAGSLGARVIAVDRPGMGLSDFVDGRKITDWPDDVEDFVDALKLERFAVLGFSGGGPYALACARALGERITATGVVSGMGPLDGAAARRAFSRAQQLRFWGARRWWPALRLAVRFSTRGVRENPERFFAAWSATLPPDDIEILERPTIRSVVIDDRKEALRQGSKGVAWELWLLAHKWGFQLEEVDAQVHLWHGEADSIVPEALGRGQARRLPHCTSQFLPDKGHLMLVDEMAEILGDLLQHARS